MAMTPTPPLALPISSVIAPSYLLVNSQIPTVITEEPIDGFFEVYGGFVSLGTGGIGDDGGDGKTTKVAVIIPTGGASSTQMNVKSYGRDGAAVPDQFRFAVTVSLAGTSPTGNHIAIESLDFASVHLIDHDLGGDIGTQALLVLNFNTSYRHTTLLRVAYNISVAGGVGFYPVISIPNGTVPRYVP